MNTAIKKVTRMPDNPTGGRRKSPPSRTRLEGRYACPRATVDDSLPQYVLQVVARRALEYLHGAHAPPSSASPKAATRRVIAGNGQGCHNDAFTPPPSSHPEARRRHTRLNSPSKNKSKARGEDDCARVAVQTRVERRSLRIGHPLTITRQARRLPSPIAKHLVGIGNQSEAPRPTPSRVI